MSAIAKDFAGCRASGGSNSRKLHDDATSEHQNLNCNREPSRFLYVYSPPIPQLTKNMNSNGKSRLIYSAIVISHASMKTVPRFFRVLLAISFIGPVHILASGTSAYDVFLELARQGFNDHFRSTLSIKDNESIREYLSSKEFHSDVNNGKFSGGVTIEGIPMSASASDDQINAASKEVTQLNDTELERVFYEAIAKSTINVEYSKLFYQAWNAYLATQSETFVVSSSQLGDTDKVTFTIEEEINVVRDGMKYHAVSIDALVGQLNSDQPSWNTTLEAPFHVMMTTANGVASAILKTDKMGEISLEFEAPKKLDPTKPSRSIPEYNGPPRIQNDHTQAFWATSGGTDKHYMHIIANDDGNAINVSVVDDRAGTIAAPKLTALHSSEAFSEDCGTYGIIGTVYLRQDSKLGRTYVFTSYTLKPDGPQPEKLLATFDYLLTQ